MIFGTVLAFAISITGFSSGSSFEVSISLCFVETLISSGFGSSVGSVNSFFGSAFFSGSTIFTSSSFFGLSSITFTRCSVDSGFAGGMSGTPKFSSVFALK